MRHRLGLEAGLGKVAFLGLRHGFALVVRLGLVVGLWPFGLEC